ncbi:hypothetical protein AB0D98_10920 [Streptomyces sp. NPDC047987]|uniref:hypothetical protein n=1 Tax=unclassified Streptomyces TaxID=2593676 RepID=UPI0034261F26
MTTQHLINDATRLINSISSDISRAAELPDGRRRNMDGPTAAGFLTAQSNLAVATALLALVAAVRGEQQ